MKDVIIARRTRRNLQGATLFVVLVALVFGAGPAQAHEWIVGGKNLKELEVVEEEGARFKSSLQSELTFEWPTSLHNFKWACTNEAANGQLLPAGKVLGAGSVVTFKWSNCHFTEEIKACAIHTPVVASVRGEIVQDEKTGVLYEKYVPSGAGAPFFEFSWGMTECAIGGTWNFAGSFAAKLEPAGIELLTQPQLFSPAIDKTMGTAIKAGEAPPVSIAGALKMTLIGEIEGQKWGAK